MAISGRNSDILASVIKVGFIIYLEWTYLYRENGHCCKKKMVYEDILLFWYPTKIFFNFFFVCRFTIAVTWVTSASVAKFGKSFISKWWTFLRFLILNCTFLRKFQAKIQATRLKFWIYVAKNFKNGNCAVAVSVLKVTKFSRYFFSVYKSWLFSGKVCFGRRK